MAKSPLAGLPKTSGRVDWRRTAPEGSLPILYFSGSTGKFGTDLLIARRVGTPFSRCFSYEGWRNEARLQWALKFYYMMRQTPEAVKQKFGLQSFGLFFDSGAFTLQKMIPDRSQIPCVVPQYALDYLAKYQRCLENPMYSEDSTPLRHAVDWYAPLDWVKDGASIRRMMRIMQDRGLFPVPIYHGDCSLDFFRAYMDEGYPIICLGRPPKWSETKDIRALYDTCFNLAEARTPKVALHGLAQTGEPMFAYPWYSVDSTAWLAGAMRSELLVYDRVRPIYWPVYVGAKIKMKYKRPDKVNRVAPDAAEAMTSRVSFNTFPFQEQKRIIDKAASYGISWHDIMSYYEARSAFNIRAQLEALTQYCHPGRHVSHIWPSLL